MCAAASSRSASALERASAMFVPTVTTKTGSFIISVLLEQVSLSAYISILGLKGSLRPDSLSLNLTELLASNGPHTDRLIRTSERHGVTHCSQSEIFNQFYPYIVPGKAKHHTE